MECQARGKIAWVLIEEEEVKQFAGRWPYFGPIHAFHFTFDKETGKLLESHGFEASHNEEAVEALAKKAKAYATQELGRWKRWSRA